MPIFPILSIAFLAQSNEVHFTFQDSVKQYKWAGTPVQASEVFTPKVDDEGVFTIPISADKDTPWTFDGFFNSVIQEASRTTGLKVTGTDLASKVLASTNQGGGVAQSSYFALKANMKTLRFRIIGTNSISRCYASLEIDGKEMFRQSPESDRQFTPIKWEIGKFTDASGTILARLKIVNKDSMGVIAYSTPDSNAKDSSQSVEAKHLIDIPLATGQVPGQVATSDSILEQFSIRPFYSPGFSTYSRLNELKMSQSQYFGVSLAEVDSLRRKIILAFAAPNTRYEASWTINDIATRVRSTVDQILLASGYQKIPKSLHQYMVAFGCCNWARFNVRYEQTPDKYANEKDAITYLLAQNPLKGMCSTKAYFERELSRLAGSDLGLQCNYVGGWYRDPQSPSTPYDSNHAWNLFTLEGGVELPADITGYVSDADYRRSKGTVGEICVLPIRPFAVEGFAATHFGIKKADGKGQSGDSTPQSMMYDSLFGMTLTRWFNTDSRYLKPMIDRYPF